MPTATRAEPGGAAPAAVARRSRRRGLAERLQRPVSADSVAVFRIVFGLVIAIGSVRFLAKGWVDSLYLAPDHHLTYAGFGWVEPLPAPLMHLHVAGLALLGLAIAAGFHHRMAAGLFTLGFAYTELIDATLYLNHYWYVTLVGVLLTVLPVHHRWSLDARSGRVAPSPTVPVAVVWVLRAQLAVVYLFAGLAKLNPDWLLHAQPLRLWFVDRSDVPLVGPLLGLTATAYVASWAGALFDLTIVGWLSWSRSRPAAYGAVIGFHAFTGMLFPIGVFPLVMITGTLVYFSPDWPSRCRPAAASVGPVPAATHLRLGTPMLVALALFGAAQLALPLRHYAYPGNVRWTDEGYLFAWRVMLTEKVGHLEFEVTDPASGDVWLVSPDLVLTDWQTTQAAIRPDLVHSTAVLVADHYRADGLDVEVRATAWVSMNGGPARLLVDPAVDLASQPRTPAPDRWILLAP